MTAVNGDGGAGARDAILARSYPTTTTTTATAAIARQTRFQVIILPTVVVVIGVEDLNVSLSPPGGDGDIYLPPVATLGFHLTRDHNHNRIYSNDFRGIYQ